MNLLHTVLLIVVVLVAFSCAIHTEDRPIGLEGVGSAPVMGWNSWNKFACNISEVLIKETADAIVSTGMRDLGYSYINIDDCWQASQRDSNGKVVEDSQRFPSGLKALGEYIHSKGLRFGIYSSSGFKTCQGFPASLGLESTDVESYVEWDVDYLKYDNCYQEHAAPEKRFHPMGKAIENAAAKTGKKIYFSLCEWGRENPAVWASSIGGNSWRTTPDIKDNWYEIVSRAEITASLWRYAGTTTGWNDPDMLEVGNGGCTDEEYRSHFSLWAIMKAPLLTGNDVRQLDKSPATRDILMNKEVVSINQDKLGFQARRIWSDKYDSQPTQLIATKCSSGEAEAYEDSPLDQEWTIQEDGTIYNPSSDECLHEVSQEKTDAYSKTGHPWMTYSLPLSRAVTTAPCKDATRWEVGAYVGGSIKSQTSGHCLEVSKLEYNPLWQGKRIQTAPCQELGNNFVDVREHQSWTAPGKKRLLNLYQRQCLTVDRDALASVTGVEIWASPLVDGKLAVMLFNKSVHEKRINLSLSMLDNIRRDNLTTKAYHVRDVWEKKTLMRSLSKENDLNAIVNSHGVALYILSPS